MSAKLLLIDDDPAWCKGIDLLLSKEGFQVETASDAMTGLQKAYGLNPDAVLLDLMLPGMDGMELCTRLRELADVPIIMLTALDSPEQIVTGLTLGADEFISKTTRPGELVARIRAVLRRTVPSGQTSQRRTSSSVFSSDHIVVDIEKHEVMVEGKRVDLSPTEFRLLSALVRFQGRVLPHDFLINEVWGPQHTGETRVLRLYIGYLRRKLEKDPSHPSLIQSEWGVGYRFG